MSERNHRMFVWRGLIRKVVTVLDVSTDFEDSVLNPLLVISSRNKVEDLTLKTETVGSNVHVQEVPLSHVDLYFCIQTSF